ncbi:hypothetical protein ACFFQF_09260 [Haladaptatus pallidirubidus]|uniref:hypothetical protein n=1 Tax=Haladaptatus pallidirubidus TaxID=1008152 RepID=UPI001D114B3E|nr:hypothetical protein [Haladaptatus pallidirubidus]
MYVIELVSTLVVQVVVFPLQFVSFWASVSLPLLYVPLLFAGFKPGIRIFVTLLAIHAVSLLLGHRYGREEVTSEVEPDRERPTDV